MQHVHAHTTNWMGCSCCDSGPITLNRTIQIIIFYQQNWRSIGTRSWVTSIDTLNSSKHWHPALVSVSMFGSWAYFNKPTFSDTVTVRAVTQHSVRVFFMVQGYLLDLQKKNHSWEWSAGEDGQLWSLECFLTFSCWPSASQLPLLDHCPLSLPLSTSLCLVYLSLHYCTTPLFYKIIFRQSSSLLDSMQERGTKGTWGERREWHPTTIPGCNRTFLLLEMLTDTSVS